MTDWIVIAGNYQQFEVWCRVHGIRPTDAVYAHSEEQLVGRHGCEIVYTGESWRNPLCGSAYLEMLKNENLKHFVPGEGEIK